MLARYVRQNLHFRSFLSKSQSQVLDFGCGEGQNSVIMSQLGLKPVGVELSPHPIWQQLPQPFLVYNGTSLPFQPHSFDACVMFGVLEHVGPSTKQQGTKAFALNQKARLAILEQIHQCLKPQGFLGIYNFPNKYSPIEIINEFLDLPTIHRGSEKQSLASVTNLVKQAGYQILESGRTGALPASIGFISPKAKETFINRHFASLSILDSFADRLFANYLGQSNYVIAKKI